MATVSSLYEIARVFEVAESSDFFGPRRSWLAENRLQDEFLALYKIMKGHILSLAPSIRVEAAVSLKPDHVTRWFDDMGVDVAVEGQESEGNFFAGCVINHFVELAVPGVLGAVKGRSGQVFSAGVKLKRGVEYFHTDFTDEKVACVALANPSDRLYMVMMERVPTETFQLLHFAAQIERHLVRAPLSDYVHFPMVHIRQQQDVSWLKQIWTQREGDYKKMYLADIRHHVSFGLSDKGARSGMNLVVPAAQTGTVNKNPLTIDRPFLLWVSRDGCPLPVFVAHVGYGDWKDPTTI